ncbi:MAG: hypothetical protein KatS3mg027_2403 [Bacteroidia bacterium]|nr:MAG: hypothetical protein KatS3mg027_2403 [Bacteroidia bacterium]
MFDNGVTAQLIIPETIKPGETVVAEVIINKGNTGGFAKLQIDVGQGLSIAEEDSKGATFSFSGNTAKWIWTALPMQSEFKVKFKVTANVGSSGSSTISGKFSYILNNAKQVVEIPTKNIQIGDKPAEAISQVSPAQPTNTETTSITTASTEVNNTNTVSVNSSTNVQVSVNTETTTNEATTVTSSTESTPIQISRTIESLSPNAWLVKISIQKGAIKGFARYNDVLPSGLKATVEDKDGSSFFVDGNTIKFVWSSLPEKSNLQISYKLSGNITTPVTLNGDFSYTENNQVRTKNLQPDVIQPSTPVSVPSSTTESAPPQTDVASGSVQAKQTVVWFSVQLGAFLKSNVSNSYFRNKYQIQDVKKEEHESYKKFYSGNFQEYKQARDYREEVKIKGIQDAFVIAHKNQVRITVQEALMITNQKWYP